MSAYFVCSLIAIFQSRPDLKGFVRSQKGTGRQFHIEALEGDPLQCVAVREVVHQTAWRDGAYNMVRKLSKENQRGGYSVASPLIEIDEFENTKEAAK